MKKKKFVVVKILAAILCIGILCWSAFPCGAVFWKRALQLIGVESPLAAAQKAEFAIYFLPVGKADAILIQADGAYMLVDGGTPGQAETVTAFLKELGVTRLHTVLLTHPDKDHYGGLSEVLLHFPVGQYVYAAVPEEQLPEEEDYVRLQRILMARHVPQGQVQAGDSFPVNGLSVSIAAPATVYADTNNCSVVAKMQYGSTTMLLTGDASSASEQAMLYGNVPLQADILKVSHHGSKGTSGEEFLRAVSPKYAVVSVGENTSGLPASETLVRLQQAGAQVYRTDLDGTIAFYGNGEELWLLTDLQKPCRLQ